MTATVIDRPFVPRAPVVQRAERWHGWFTTIDHKDVGILYLLTTSPPAAYNFAPGTLPPIRSARPLWDLKHPHSEHDSDTAPPGPVQATRTWLERVPLPVLGTLTFLTSESIFFGALIATFVVYHNASVSGPGPHMVDVMRTGLFSIALWAGSGTVWLATRAHARGNDSKFGLWLLLTIALGLVFMYGQATEYTRLYGENITISTNLFTSTFFTLTGFHGFHVALGLVALSILAGLAFGGVFKADQHRVGVEAVSIYWHFVDGVWVVLYVLVYLWSLAA